MRSNMFLKKIFLVSAFIAIAAATHTPDSICQDITKEQLTTLSTSADPDAVADVIYKLSDLAAAKGGSALKPAVPAILAAAKRELSLPEDQRWNIYDIIKLASMSGDERVKPLLLQSMSSMGGGGNPFTAQGFLAIGASTVKDLADSLVSKTPETRGRAAITLNKMQELDTAGTFFTAQQKQQIRDLLIKNIADANASVRLYAVIALRSFGDASVISPLEHIEKTDAHKDSGGTYEVRVEAAETLKILKGK